MKACAIAVVIVSLAGSVCAERGNLPLVEGLDLDAVVHTPVQRALILFDGGEELLILCPDMRAGKRLTVLQFLPLPSEPTIAARVSTSASGSPNTIKPTAAWDLLASYIKEHAPRKTALSDTTGVSTPVERLANSDIAIALKPTVECRPLKVVKIERPADLISCASDIAAAADLPFTPAGLTALCRVTEDYLKRGFSHFAFNVVELSPEARSVEPLVFRFKTDRLYYPLLASSLDEGTTQIDLFLVTRRSLILPANSPFRAGRYIYDQFQWSPIAFWIHRSYIEKLDPRIKDLFPEQMSLHFTALRATRRTTALREDFILK